MLTAPYLRRSALLETYVTQQTFLARRPALLQGFFHTAFFPPALIPDTACSGEEVMFQLCPVSGKAATCAFSDFVASWRQAKHLIPRLKSCGEIFPPCLLFVLLYKPSQDISAFSEKNNKSLSITSHGAWQPARHVARSSACSLAALSLCVHVRVCERECAGKHGT